VQAWYEGQYGVPLAQVPWPSQWSFTKQGFVPVQAVVVGAFEPPPHWPRSAPLAWQTLPFAHAVFAQAVGVPWPTQAPAALQANPLEKTLEPLQTELPLETALAAVQVWPETTTSPQLYVLLVTLWH
jgi:hypothetical protein